MGQAQPDASALEQFARPAVFISAHASLGAALKQMQSSRVHFAFVIDEHGGLDGILTLEDLLEEIVGEIDDEYDEETRSQCIEQPDGTYLLDGMLAVHDANRHLGLDLPESSDYTTIAGFLMAQAGRVLQPGNKVEYDGAIFEIERMKRFRIRSVRFTHSSLKEGPADSRQVGVLLPFVSTAAATHVSELNFCAELIPICM